MESKNIEKILLQINKNLINQDKKKLIQNYEKLNILHKKNSDKWMQIYTPSLTGFEKVIIMMKKNEFNNFKIEDPVKNYYINGYKMYLSEWLFKKLNKDNHDIYYLCYKYNDLDNKIKIILNRNNIFKIKIIIKKMMDTRKFSKLNQYRYITYIEI